ncbi:MAG: DUF3810 domain-containing protein [Tannerellaceae bacterium]
MSALMWLRQRLSARHLVLVTLLVLTWVTMLFPILGEVYARRVYPLLHRSLADFSRLFPFSVGDCFIYGSLVGLLLYLVFTLIMRRPLKRVLWRMAEYLAWVYVWFYLAWGMNYFRQDFFTRAGISYEAYTPDHFCSFLVAYTDSLNAAYVPITTVDTATVRREVMAGYRAIGTCFGILPPEADLRVKSMLLTPLMSSVGVMGYMGPFFNEFNLNRDLLPVQYSSTYAHEMAHVLGIASEAEANLYSHLVCIRSDNPSIRFSGYFSLLTYVLENARLLLSEHDFNDWKQSLRPEVKALYNANMLYWQSRYSPLIGEVQNVLYNLFLKGNNIDSGTQNYSEVIALLIAYRQVLLLNQVSEVT